MSMLTIHLLRHAQSPCSASGLVCGSECDVGLTATGSAAALDLAQRFAGEAVAGIYCSPQRRARETAAPLTRITGRPLSIDPRLREITYGQWDGRRPDDLPQEQLHAFRAGRASPPGGESLAVVADRAVAAFDALRNKHPHGTVWVISHHTTLRLLLCRLLDEALDHYRSRCFEPATFGTLLCDGSRLTTANLGQR